jgi:hypothetical protein
MARSIPLDLEIRWRVRSAWARFKLFLYRRTYSFREFWRWYTIRERRGKSQKVYIRWLNIKTAAAQRQTREFKLKTASTLQGIADFMGVPASEMKQYLDNL